MRTKNLTKKLSISKKTIANLNATELQSIQGGTMTDLPEATCFYVSCTCPYKNCQWP